MQVIQIDFMILIFDIFLVYICFPRRHTMYVWKTYYDLEKNVNTLKSRKLKIIISEHKIKTTSGVEPNNIENSNR